MPGGGTPAPRLMGITPAEYPAGRLRELLPDLAPHLDAVLLRWPRRSAREILAAARTLAAATPRPMLLLSDRLDLVLVSGVEGIQLKERGIPPDRIPSRFRPSLVGVSRHDAAGVSASAGVDFLTLSPVRKTSSKPDARPLGLDGFGAIAVRSPVPVLALGGMRPRDVAAVVDRGAHGVAMISGVFGSGDPVASAAEYAAALREARRA
jgi:thiazole tautomerase (transcriptional regulator TenI)